MMKILKEDVINTAELLFKKHGYLAVTIQDIADTYGVAKGSIYKFFSSKEALFSEVFDRCQNEYFVETKKLYEQAHPTTRIRFLQQIVFRFQYFLTYQHILVAFTELPIQQDDTFETLRKRVRARLIEWHRKCLMDFYGDKLTHNRYDLIFIYRAILKEYLSWVIEAETIVSLENIAENIINKMDVLVEDSYQNVPQPIISSENYTSYIHGTKTMDKQTMITRLLTSMETTIGELQSQDEMSATFTNLLNTLKSELINKPVTNKPLLQAILFYFEQEKTLMSSVIQLKHILFTEDASTK